MVKKVLVIPYLVVPQSCSELARAAAEEALRPVAERFQGKVQQVDVAEVSLAEDDPALERVRSCEAAFKEIEDPPTLLQF